MTQKSRRIPQDQVLSEDDMAQLLWRCYLLLMEARRQREQESAAEKSADTEESSRKAA